MKHYVIFFLVAIAVFNIGFSAPVKDLEEQWQKFKVDFNKKYNTIEEEDRRKEIFRKTVEMIEEHNAKYAEGLTTFTMGINIFADMTDKEKKRYGTGVLPRNSKLVSL